MPQQALRKVIEAADLAINREAFDDLMEFYTEDAVLVVQPEMNAHGIQQIRTAFPAIANFFNHTLEVTQGEMRVVASGDTALVLARTELKAEKQPGQPWRETRLATYVFRREPTGEWRCAVDNSYGTTLLEPPTKLHLMCGKIGSGKSTLAQQLGTQPKTVLISEDAWLAKLYPEAINELADYVRCANLLKNVLGSHVAELLSGGMSVVLDIPANTPMARQWAKTILAKTGVAHTLHYLDVPDEVCKKRLRIRNQSGTHPFTVDDAAFELISSYFVPPYPDEGFNVVTH